MHAKVLQNLIVQDTHLLLVDAILITAAGDVRQVNGLSHKHCDLMAHTWDDAALRKHAPHAAVEEREDHWLPTFQHQRGEAGDTLTSLWQCQRL